MSKSFEPEAAGTEDAKRLPPEGAAHLAAEPAPGDGNWLKRVLIGRPRATAEMPETLLRKLLALPIFSSDPLSSVAYATESALVVLVGASLASRHLVLPIAIAIGVFLAIVIVSYTQVVRAYTSSGGAYVVAKENLGRMPSLLGGAALLTDYVLTVAVSVAAGVLAITSAVPSLASHKLALSLACVAVITLVNLRGVREAGIAFAFPTYGFLAAFFVMIVVGLVKCTGGACPQAVVPDPIATGAGTVGLFVILKAFASGSVALTGVEAIANGVTAFRPPQSRNAAQTQLAMGAMSISMFIGVTYLAVRMDARPSDSASVVSEIARATFPGGSAASAMYYVVQVFTLAILVFAANTSYQGFPRLAAIMARDGYFPRQFTNLGDRLVFSNGIVVLAGVSALLLVAFKADVISLIHLYVIGVFTAFTLSQAGMVRYWLRTRAGRWRRSAVINSVGAVTTGVVAVIVVFTKFTEGAWMVVVAIPLLILAFLAIHRHYRTVARRLRAGTAAVLSRAAPTNTVVLYVESLDAATEEAFWYARAISGGSFQAVHVPLDGTDPGLRPRFEQWAGGRPHLEVLAADGGSPADAVLEHVWSIPHGEGDFVTVVIPEVFERPSLLAALLRRSTLSLKFRLLGEPGVVVTDVPRLSGGSVSESFIPARAVCVVPISDVHAASARAVVYARSLGFPDTRSVFFAFDESDSDRVSWDWKRREMGIPLDVVESPYRDLGAPLLTYVRQITADPEAVAVVVMPEVVVHGWRRLLHNQRALYVKRLLLFEPRVVLVSVPYQLL
jgi:amino acid transporter